MSHRSFLSYTEKERRNIQTKEFHSTIRMFMQDKMAILYCRGEHTSLSAPSGPYIPQEAFSRTAQTPENVPQDRSYTIIHSQPQQPLLKTVHARISTPHDPSYTNVVHSPWSFIQERSLLTAVPAAEVTLGT